MYYLFPKIRVNTYVGFAANPSVEPSEILVKEYTAMMTAEFDEVRKEKLLKAALSLFVNRGFYGVAVPKIAESAGMATGSVYRYFANKEELVNELYYRLKVKFREIIVENYPAERPIAQQFDFIWRGLYQFADFNAEGFMFIEGHCHASYLDARCHSIENDLFEIGRSFIRAGQAAGAIRQGPDQLLVAMFFGAFAQFFKDCQAGRLEWNETSSNLLKDYCWFSLATPLAQ